MNQVLTSPVPSFRPSPLPSDCSTDVDTGTQTDWGASPPRSKRTNEKSLDDCLSILQGEIWKILGNVNLEEVELKVGKTSLRQDQAVVLAWNQIQTLHPVWNQSLEQKNDEEGDGTLLYLAIKIKKRSLSNDENNNESVSKDDQFHNERTIKSKKSKPNQPKNGKFITAIKKTIQPKLSSKFKHQEIPSEPKQIDPETIISDWKALVTLQRGVSSKELSGLFKEDKFRHRSKDEPSVFDEIAHVWEQESCQSSQTVIDDLSASSVIAGSRKNKKSVRWKEQLEEPLPTRTPSSSQPGNAQNRPDSVRQSRRDKFESSSSPPTKSGSKLAQPRKQPTQRRNGSLEFPKPRKRRHEVLHKLDDDHNSPRSRSVEIEDPVGVLTSRVCDLESLATKNKVPEMHNMIRRRRCNHAKSPENIWFGGPSFKSFNSRCLVGRYDRHTLDDDAKQYFYFRSLPRISN